MILLAEQATGQKQGGQTLIGGLDVTVNRNYFGRQVDSFETGLERAALGDAPVQAIFIRAPAITALGLNVGVAGSHRRTSTASLSMSRCAKANSAPRPFTRN